MKLVYHNRHDLRLCSARGLNLAHFAGPAVKALLPLLLVLLAAFF